MSKTVPEVRFDEFNGEWEEKFLGNEVEFYSGLTYSPEDIVTKNGTLVIRSSNVKNGELVDADNVYVDSSKVNSEKVMIGDIIVVVRNGSRHLIGKHATVKKNMDNTVIGAFMTGIRSENSNFTNAILDTTQFTIEINKNLGATINQITNGNFKKMKFFFPSNKEQQKIGTIFKQLDDTIALHQQLVEQQQQYKKAMLQKMFPQKGERVPKVRFAGFSGDWECNNLENIVIDIGTGKSKYSIQTESLQAPYKILGSTSVIGYDNSFDYDGDFILTARVGANAGTLYHYSGKVKITDNTVFIQSENLKFTFYLLLNFDLKTLSYGTGQPLIKSSELKKLKLNSPLMKEEQQKIGTFFKLLDDTIALHEKKLEDYQQLKKAFLKRMFV
jgi:type I restriction enzyme S subunit